MRGGHIYFEESQPTHPEIADRYPALSKALDVAANTTGVGAWFELMELLSYERARARKGLLEGIKQAMDESIRKEDNRR